MHKTPASALSFVETFSDLEISDHVRVIICAPYLALESLVQKASAPLGIQNLHRRRLQENQRFLLTIGVGIVLIGHSEDAGISVAPIR